MGLHMISSYDQRLFIDDIVIASYPEPLQSRNVNEERNRNERTVFYTYIQLSPLQDYNVRSFMVTPQSTFQLLFMVEVDSNSPKK